MPDVPILGGWRLRFNVPEGTFTLAVEADETTAQADHAAFAERCLPLLSTGGDRDGARLRREIITQLGALRQAVGGSGLRYLGALTGVHDDRPVLVLVGIAAAPLPMPDGVSPASLLAALLRHRYPAALVEEFSTTQGEAVGMRRYDELSFSTGMPGEEPVSISSGISQVLAPFPEAGLLATVTGLCYPPDDIDLATVFTATIACRMTAIHNTSDAGQQNPLHFPVVQMPGLDV